MTTPDTEWEKSTKEIVEDFVNQCRKAETSYGLIDISYEHLRELITEALTSRDTYWKERVRKEVDRIDQDDHGAVENILRFKIKAELLQALDNLK